MIRYALLSLRSKKTVSLLFVLALSLTMMMSLLGINISQQVQEGFYSADQKSDIIIGPTGSEVQLVMSSLFFSEDALGTVSYEVVEALQEEGLQKVIPIAIGDYYKGARIIGTSPELIEDYHFNQGRNIEKAFEVVLGSAVAKAYGIQVGDELISSHGVGSSLVGMSHDHFPYKVVGLLESTHTAYDQVVFTTIESVWQAHETHEHSSLEEVSHESSEETHDHEEAHEHEGEVTAILVRTGVINKVSQLLNTYNQETIQAVNVTRVLRKLLEQFDLSKQIAFLLTVMIVVLGMMIVGIMTFLMAQSFKGDIYKLNFIGMSKQKISCYINVQLLIMIGSALILAIVLSRVGIYGIGKLSSQYGIVLDLKKTYKEEGLVLVSLALMSFLPLQLYRLFKNK